MDRAAWAGAALVGAAVGFVALDTWLGGKLEPPSSVLWTGPVSPQQVSGTGLAGVPSFFLPCKGNSSPTCRQLAAGWRSEGRVLPRLRQELGLPPGRVFVAAFSAGGSAVKELLEHPADRAELAGVHLADATYTTDLDAQGRPLPIGVFATFGRDVLARGDQLFVVTASSNPNPSTERPGVVNPSAAATLAATRAAIASDARWSRRPPKGLPPPGASWSRGRVLLLDYGSSVSHQEHATQLARDVWRLVVTPSFKSGAPPAGTR